MMSPLSTLILAKKARRHGDQNRIEGLFRANDMLPSVDRYLRGNNREVLHLDIHTFDRARPLPGWGEGINIVCHHGDAHQMRVARRVASRLAALGFPSTAVEMERSPTSYLDDDSNSLTDWSSMEGCTSLLMEFPVERVGPVPHQERCWALPRGWGMESLGQAVVHAVAPLMGGG